MAPVLYMCSVSPPSRSALMTAKAIGLELEIKIISLLHKEHLNPEFVELNPQHTLPTLVDEDLVLWDSHAIMVYFMNKYAKDDSLYPTDPKNRAIIDQRLHFEGSVLFRNMTEILYPMILGGETIVEEKQKKNAENNYGLLEHFLQNNDWIAGNSLSIADLSIVTTLTTLDVFVPIEKDKYPKTIAWLDRFESLPYYKINKDGVDAFRKGLEQKLKI